MKLYNQLLMACVVPGCDIRGPVLVPVTPRMTAEGAILYVQDAGEKLRLPAGWSAEGLCPEHARPLDLGQEPPPPKIAAKAAQLRALASHPDTPPHEAESAWAALRKLSQRYALEEDRREDPD